MQETQTPSYRRVSEKLGRTSWRRGRSFGVIVILSVATICTGFSFRLTILTSLQAKPYLTKKISEITKPLVKSNVQVCSRKGNFLMK
jgi:hypothetical protein